MTAEAGCLTFSGFEDLVNRWILETLAMNEKYFDQTEEVKLLFKKVKNNLKRITDMKHKLNIFNVLLKMLDENIKMTEEIYKETETIICDLENKEKKEDDIKDVTICKVRTSIFNNAERINQIINEMKNDCEELNERLQSFNTQLKKADPKSEIEEAIDSQTTLLESIEGSYYQLVSLLRQTECCSKESSNSSSSTL